jgi:hypothetical protein
MEIDKKIKADIAFLLELQKHKTEKTPNGGWDINLFKSSFVNKIKSLSKMGQQKSINAILDYFESKNKELGLPPIFTTNHNIWNYRTEKMDKEEVFEPNTNDEFYDVIFAQIEPHDDWYGNVIKERYIKRQIAQLIKSDGQEPSESEIEEIFQVYKDKFIKNNPSFESDNNKIYYTTAPESYDGFGTHTVESTNWYTKNDKQFRKVSVPEKNIEWQLGRYSSGGNLSFFTEDAFNEFKEDLFFYKEPVTEKKYELGFGFKGNGTTIWNRLNIDPLTKDYKNLANVSDSGEVYFYDKDLPLSVIEEIENYAKLKRKKEPEFEEISNEIYYTTAPKSFDEFGTYTIEETNWYANNDNQFRKVSIPEKSLLSQLNKYNSVGNFAVYRPSVFNDVKEKIFTNKKNLITPEQVAIVQPEWDKMQEFLNEGKEKEVDKLKVIKPFFGKGQYEVVKGHLDSYKEVIGDLYSTITTMPKTYETDDIRKNDKIAYLHYFTSSSDWYIVEKDIETEQFQAFGLAVLNGDLEYAELGYISIEELKKYAELDFYFDPKKISEIIEEESTTEEKPLEILKPLSPENPLDVQLRALTGDGYNWSDYTDENGETPTSGGIIVHKETGRRFKAPSSFNYFKGIENDYSNQFNLNKGIEEFLDSKDNDYIFSDQEKSFLYLYEGYGGLEKEGATGSVLLWEYYTPQLLIKKMWGLANKYGFNQGKVLEPSVGVGRFLDFSEGSNVTAYEINPYSARICKILHPKANVLLKSFEEHFYTGNTFNPKFEKDFDLVIGNPPYGDVTGKRSVAESKRLKVAVRKWEHYFILRGLDTLKSGGLLIYVSTANLFTKGYEPLKEKIGDRAELIDAYLLPNKTFKRTQINTSLIVLRKK